MYRCRSVHWKARNPRCHWRDRASTCANVVPLRQGKALAWNSQSPRMCVGIALYFAAKYIGSSHIRSLPSQFTTGSTPVCSTLKDQAITRNELSNVPGHTSDFLLTVIKHRWLFVIPEPISELKVMTMRLFVVGELSSIVQAAGNEPSFVFSQQFQMVPQNFGLLQFIPVTFGCSKVASGRRFPQARPLTEQRSEPIMRTGQWMKPVARCGRNARPREPRSATNIPKCGFERPLEVLRMRWRRQ